MGLKKEIDEISNVLDRGFNVVIFPEATTSDASRVLPFRSSLVESAVKKWETYKSRSHQLHNHRRHTS